MNAVAQHEPSMVPYFTFALFAGIRPSEIQRLDWSAIDWSAKEVFVGANVSKSGNERYVKLQDNAMEWLLPHRRDAEIIHYDRSEFESARSKAGVEWGHDILRHTFGSMHLAAFRNAGDTAEQMGHGSSTTMLFKHYRRAVRQQDAEQFWEIKPREESAVSNIEDAI